MSVSFFFYLSALKPLREGGRGDRQGNPQSVGKNWKRLGRRCGNCKREEQENPGTIEGLEIGK